MSGQRARLVALAALGLLGACASVPPPEVSDFRRVEEAVEQARAERASDHAPMDLGIAEERLAQARQALAADEPRRARQALIEAELAAELARAKSRAARARAAVQARRAENALLRRELLGEGER
ncbi:MAG: DUF4398 domain-containing protein [Xanthomonadales bacterium]|nr:DUF4398 domain-containing protein [Xanthomonadales bacterium]